MPKYKVTIETTDYRFVELQIEADNDVAAEAEAQRRYEEEPIAWDDEGTTDLHFDAVLLPANPTE